MNSTLKRILAVIPLLCLMALTLVLLLAQRSYDDRLPEDAAWELVARWLKPRLKKTDSLAVNPSWLSSGRYRIERILPEKQNVPPEPVIQINERHTINPANLQDMQRFWLISVPSLVGQRIRLPEGWAATPIRLDGRNVSVYRGIVPFEIRLFAKQRPVVLYDMVRNLRLAKVWRINSANKRQDCRSVGARVVCPKPNRKSDWFDLTRKRADISPSGALAIYAHIAQQRGQLILQYPQVPMGRWIEGHFGWWMHAMNVEHGGAVELEIRIDGRTLGYIWMHPNDNRWRPFRLDTREYEGGFHTVTFHLRGGDWHWRISLLEARSVR